MFFKIIVSSFLFISSLYASEQNLFKEASEKFGVRDTLLVAISKQESDFEPKAIGIMIKDKSKCEAVRKCFDIVGCHYKINKSCTHASVLPTKEDDITLSFLILEKLDLDYDVGLMQINRWNIKKRNLEKFRLLQDARYNTSIGATILKECIDRFPENIIYSLECYNKGTNTKKYNGSYARKVLKQYKKLFME